MKAKTGRNIINTVDNILQVTKNTIQLNENYYDYYINKDDSLYMKQLPLLIQKSKMQAVAIKRRENEKNFIDREESDKKSNSIDKLVLPLNNIRNAQIRSKKLPPLCPFYSNKGELLRSVVKTSKLFNKQYLNDDILMSSPSSKKKVIKNVLGDGSNPGSNSIVINFDDFQNDFFFEPEYSSLVFKDSDIFGKTEYYFELIKNKINDFKVNEINDQTYKREKIFDKNKQKKNISLIFDSLSVKIYELKKENENEKTNKDVQIFEYNLPFIYLPLFYFKGEEKFKIILSKIIQWDNEKNKFLINENPEVIFKDILNNCIDFKEEKKEEQKKEIPHLEEQSLNRPSKQKFSMTMGGKKSLKKEMAGFKFNPLGSTIIEEQNLAQTMAGAIPSTYLTNLDDSKRRYDIVSQSSIYPTPKESNSINYINYNIFEFLWLTPNKNFKVCINTPIVTINIPKNNIKVKKYIDFELLFYLYENNFENWHFYLVKYLSSYKSFRTLLEEINSINECYNKDFYLTKPRIKNYVFNNTKIINIATIKQKDILENLIEGLMGIPEEKIENQHKDEKNNKSKFKNASKKEMIKIDKKEEEKKEDKKEEKKVENEKNDNKEKKLDNKENKENESNENEKNKNEDNINEKKEIDNNKEGNEENKEKYEKEKKEEKEEKDEKGTEGEKIDNDEKEEKKEKKENNEKEDKDEKGEKEEKDEKDEKGEKGEKVDKDEKVEKKDEKEEKDVNSVDKEKEKVEEISNTDLVNSTFVQKCFIAVVRFVDTKTFKAHEYKIYFNFNQFQKFQKMEKYIDKISFLIKFIDINHIKKSVTIDYKSLDNFDENEWIKDFNQYNTQYIKTLDNRTTNLPDYHRTNAEYLGMTKNSVIQIEIYTPISLARTLSESGSIKTEKILLNNDYQDKAVYVEKDDILKISKIFYNCYGEENAKKL